MYKWPFDGGAPSKGLTRNLDFEDRGSMMALCGAISGRYL
jgi:hypothetical protein